MPGDAEVNKKGRIDSDWDQFFFLLFFFSFGSLAAKDATMSVDAHALMSRDVNDSNQ